MAQIIVSLSNVTIRCPDQTIYRNISFEIKKGENWALVGENDTLKNALIEALAGKVAIINGIAHFPFFDRVKDEENLKDAFLSPHKMIAHVSNRHQFKNLSNTSQFYYQQRFNSSDSENSLTVQEYLARTKQTHHGGGWTIDNIISKLKLEELLDEQLIKLSNGETKRLLIAAALLSNPVILLLTNPFTGLDIQTRKETTDLINQVVNSGITVVMSTSSTEIPETITHVAKFEKDNTITTTPKENFAAVDAMLRHQPAIDEAEVKALLAINSIPPFNDVVVMQDVSIKYGNRLILDKINWTIKQGERWALVGHNGAGKSTLLSLINGDNPQAFANNIILFDRKKGSGESIWDIKKKIGFFSPELYQYFPLETSCLQAVESGFYDTMGLFRPSNPTLASIALRWMKLLGVGDLSRKLLKHVSITEQRLCLLARAFVKSPALFILDEPCQGFSVGQQQMFKQLLNTICASANVTLIYVSHYKNEIPESVTKELKLQDGKQVE